ncbi:MAG: transcription elongation factor Spt5 [Candidatus Aenigmarchaeota archaeon]|nr:transcription elongation factor Spt5 [Candidatus Aenigmarchaeota archaeon]
MSIFAIRTTVGREKTVLDSLDTKIRVKNPGIKALMSPGELKGYLFIEGDDEDVRHIAQGVPHVRGIVAKDVELSEIAQFFAENQKEITFHDGDLVEVIGGPFKREKAKIVRLDETKREAKIELVESAVPIPITIKLDLLKPSRNSA